MSAPPRKGASQQEVAEHIAKLVYAEIMHCHHYKVSWRSRDGQSEDKPMIIQPLTARAKTITIDIDGGADEDKPLGPGIARH